MTRACLILGLVFVTLGVGCEPPDGSAEIWRFAIEETRGSVQDRYAQWFAERIRDRTDGEVEVIVYPYGALGTSDHLTEQLHNGTLELAMSSPGHLGKLIPEVQVFLLHFLLTEDPALNARALRDEELRGALDALYAEKGLSFLTAFGEGEMVWTTQREVRRPADFEGVRMRVMTSPLLLASYEAYGASPTPLPYAEVYSGLQLHMIDGQVNPLFAIEEMSFYEVTEVLTFPGHAEFVTTLAANEGFVRGLPPPRREALLGVVDELQLEIEAWQRGENQRRLEAMRRRRPELTIVRLDDDERAAFEERAQAVRREYLAQAGERGARLLEVFARAVERARAASASAPPTPAGR